MKKMLFLSVILISAVCFAMPLPKIYLPFEGTDGYFDRYDPVWINQAPGAFDGELWFAETGNLGANNNVPAMMPKIAIGQGLKGSDCLDLTDTNSEQQLGTLYYGKLKNTADSWFANTPAEAAFDNAVSVTITGWFNTADVNKAIGYDDQVGARLFNKYGQFQVLVNQGRLAVLINGKSAVYSDWNTYNSASHKGQWVYFAITYDGNIATDNNVKFYVATEETPTMFVSEKSSIARGPITNSLGQYVIIGNYGIGATHGNASFNGLLDNLRVFSSHTDSGGALDINDIELNRQFDLGITDPVEADIYFAGDLDKDYQVGLGDIDILAEQWLENELPQIPTPQVHLAFDDADGSAFDELNPAFANKGSAGFGELPSMIGRIPESDPNYSEYPDGISLSVSDQGIKGGALDLTARAMNSYGSMLVYGNTDPQGTDTAIQQALDWPLSLTFTCWWKHSNSAALNEPAFLLRRVGELSFWADRRVQPVGGFFGEIGFVPNDDDENSGNMIYSPWVYPETDEWVFFAFTIDMLLDQSDPAVGRIKWYRGTVNQPLTLHTQVQFPLDEILAPAAGSPLVIGNYSHITEEAVSNFSALIDEIRLYVSKTDSSSALTIAQLEAIRQNDAQEYLTKQADSDKDGEIGLSDFSVIAEQWLQSQTPFEMLPFKPDNAKIYLPFENDNGLYGFGSEANPAWMNVANSEAPSYVGNDQAAYPTITTDGIKGDAFYASDPSKAGETTVTTNWTGSTTNAFSNVQSYTVTGWINTRDVNQNGSGGRILRSFDGGMELFWRTDGRLVATDTVDATARFSDWGEGYSNGQWVFFAITRDSESIRFYFGDETSAVTAGKAYTGISLANTAACSRVVLGGRTYNGTDVYFNGDMDEIRVFSNSNDNGGALSLEQLEDLRKFDLGI